MRSTVGCCLCKVEHTPDFRVDTLLDVSGGLFWTSFTAATFQDATLGTLVRITPSRTGVHICGIVWQQHPPPHTWLCDNGTMLHDSLVVRSNVGERFTLPHTTRTSPPTRASMTKEGGFLEAWAQGYYVGGLIILILIVICNYRSGRWLHKLILLEPILALWHGTFIFVKDPYYGWYLSATATLLFISYSIHNVVSWLKIRPFLPRRGSHAFILSLLFVQPFWIVEAWSNFAYFNSLGSDANVHMRPWEALFRDPWWIFTTWKLLDAIKKTYGLKLWTLCRINRRFGVMIMCMWLSIVFLVTDVAVSAARITADSGINPYWRFALVFKCASDTIFLDDFKSVLDDIVAHTISANEPAQRRSIGGFRRGSQKRSRSISRGQHFVEDAHLDTVSQTALVSQAPYAKRPSFTQPFVESTPRRPNIPSIHIPPHRTVTPPESQYSHTSYGSQSPILPPPAHSVRNNRVQRASESNATMFPRNTG